MAISLSSVKMVRAQDAPRFVVHGVQGIGKTSLAAEFPRPVFLQLEDGTPGGLEIASFGDLASYEEVIEAFSALYHEQHDFQTVVVDTLDAMEPYVWARACALNGWGDIEEPGYGKGYLAADEVWREYLTWVNTLRHKGIAVVQIAHTAIERFNSPLSEPYDRYQVKLHRRGSALVQENADVVAFLNYQTSIKEVDVGFDKKVRHAEGGGIRQIYLEERPGFYAKNRYGMPSVLAYRRGKGFSAMAKYLPGGEPDVDEVTEAAA